MKTKVKLKLRGGKVSGVVEKSQKGTEDIKTDILVAARGILQMEKKKKNVHSNIKENIQIKNTGKKRPPP